MRIRWQLDFSHLGRFHRFLHLFLALAMLFAVWLSGGWTLLVILAQLTLIISDGAIRLRLQTNQPISPTATDPSAPTSAH